jgi:hypothetical protein
MYLQLKRLGFASNVPDRAKSLLLHKMYNQLSKYIGKISAPMIIVFNLTRTPDTDLHGIVYALQGSSVDNIVMNERPEIVGRYETYERDPSFVNLEDAKSLSAVIYYSNKNTDSDIKLEGDIITNDSAAVKLEEGVIRELKEILFG